MVNKARKGATNSNGSTYDGGGTNNNAGQCSLIDVLTGKKISDIVYQKETAKK
jgi:hypothetical protein